MDTGIAKYREKLIVTVNVLAEAVNEDELGLEGASGLVVRMSVSGLVQKTAMFKKMRVRLTVHVFV